MSYLRATLSEAVGDVRAGRFDQAAQACDQVLAQQPDQPDALNLSGIICHRLGRLDAARDYLSRAVATAPGQPGYHNNLGEVYRALGDRRGAAQAYCRALALDENFAQAHINLGNVLFDEGQFERAIASYHTALELKNDIPSWHVNLGNALGRCDRFAQAIESYRQAIAIDPIYVEAHNMLGMAQRGVGDYDQAEQSLRRALSLQPNYVMALNNLGIVLKESGRLDEAEQVLVRAIALQPDYAQLHDTLGITRMAQGRLAEAITCFDNALTHKPGYAQAHWNRALAWLAGGDERGWREYEWRFEHDPTLRRDFDQPRWDGSPLDGRTILLHAEQGLGDTIQFVRFARQVTSARGEGLRGLRGRVIVECQPPLMQLLQSVEGIDALVTPGMAYPAFDVQAPLASLPLISGCRFDELAHPVPYIHAEPALQFQCARKLGRPRDLLVGLNWQGNPNFATDRFRSIPLTILAPLAQVAGVQLISIQHGHGREQLRQLPAACPIRDFGAELDVMAASGNAEPAALRMSLAAATIAHFDLVITSDTMLAHLAGAMGRPIWLMVSSSPDWRWQHHRSDNPWYPTMRVFRQPQPNDWHSVVNQVAAGLREMARHRRAAAA